MHALAIEMTNVAEKKTTTTTSGNPWSRATNRTTVAWVHTDALSCVSSSGRCTARTQHCSALIQHLCDEGIYRRRGTECRHRGAGQVKGSGRVRRKRRANEMLTSNKMVNRKKKSLHSLFSHISYLYINKICVFTCWSFGRVERALLRAINGSYCVCIVCVCEAGKSEGHSKCTWLSWAEETR